MAEASAYTSETYRITITSCDLAADLARHGRETILARHTCAHRVDELLAVAEELELDAAPCAAAAVDR